MYRPRFPTPVLPRGSDPLPLFLTLIEVSSFHISLLFLFFLLSSSLLIPGLICTNLYFWLEKGQVYMIILYNNFSIDSQPYTPPTYLPLYYVARRLQSHFPDSRAGGFRVGSADGKGGWKLTEALIWVWRRLGTIPPAVPVSAAFSLVMTCHLVSAPRQQSRQWCPRWPLCKQVIRPALSPCEGFRRGRGQKCV